MSIEGWAQRVNALSVDLTALEFDDAGDDGLTGAQLVKEMRQVIGVKATRKKATLGGSKLGGRPHAEVGFEWPTAKNLWSDGAIEPLALIAQLNLAEMAPHDPHGVLPGRGLVSFFMLPIEYDPMAHKARTHVERGTNLVVQSPPAGLADAGGVFEEKSLEFFPTVVFPDPNGGFRAFDDPIEKRIQRLLKKHGMRPADFDGLLDGPRFSSGKLKRYSRKKDVILLRFFGEVLGDGSPWFETEILLVAGRDALQRGELDDARIVMGEAT
ncbi:MAG: DUF1963 domain-containing protein [Deltaproteobacteria bacterium]|jgi:hypothetical protein|nr:DUF1963 domain-containing protein [Deltaproteobacteria bacterium]